MRTRPKMLQKGFRKSLLKTLSKFLRRLSILGNVRFDLKISVKKLRTSLFIEDASLLTWILIKEMIFWGDGQPSQEDREQ